MPIGDDALAAGMTILDGSEQADDIDVYINETRDFIAQHAGGVAPVAKGGTGSSTAAGARANLDVPSNADLATKADAGHIHGGLFVTGASLQYRSDLQEWNVGPSNFYVGGYLRVIGTIFNPSTRRIKDGITAAPEVADAFPTLYEYRRKDEHTGKRELGYIAEELVGTDAERFVHFDKDGRPDGINYLGLLIVQVAQLQARVAELEARES
jgi:hypothetical protein